MGDLQLLLFNFFFFFEEIFISAINLILNLIMPIEQKSPSLFSQWVFAHLPQNLTLFFSLKFCLCIALLILIRGGAPRYRYDYLTKLGWLKFLSFIILIFIFILFFFILF